MQAALSIDLMQQILPDVTEIVRDDEVQTLKEKIVTQKETLKVSDVMPEIMTLMISKHKENILSIMAAITGKAVEEVSFTPELIAKTSAAIDETLAFFGLCLRMVLNA